MNGQQPLHFPKTRKRTLKLLATFPKKENVNESSFAQGWVFAVPDSFKDALDIKFTERKINGANRMVLTQGLNFSFKQGDTLHDSVDAHWNENKGPVEEFTWEVAATNVHLALQVISATPSAPPPTTTELDQNKNLTANDGYVRFEVYIKKPGTCKLIAQDVLECSQIEFIKLLHSGMFNTFGSKDIINIYNLYPKTV